MLRILRFLFRSGALFAESRNAMRRCFPRRELSNRQIRILVLTPADRPPLLFRSGRVTSSPPSPFRSIERRFHFLGLVLAARSNLFAAVFPQAARSEAAHAL